MRSRYRGNFTCAQCHGFFCLLVRRRLVAAEVTTFLLSADALTSITPARPATAANSHGRTSSSHLPAPTLPDSEHPWSRWAKIERTSASYASGKSFLGFLLVSSQRLMIECCLACLFVDSLRFKSFAVVMTGSQRCHTGSQR